VTELPAYAIADHRAADRLADDEPHLRRLSYRRLSGTGNVDR
jgi:hypothetical protein